MVDEPSPKRVSVLHVPGGGSYTYDGRPSRRQGDPCPAIPVLEGGLTLCQIVQMELIVVHGQSLDRNEQGRPEGYTHDAGRNQAGGSAGLQ